jgi:hypothetical protein
LKDYEKCKYCKYARLNEEYLESTEAYPPDELDYLVCTSVENIHSGRNINSGSARLVSMDTDIKVPRVSFQVDDNDCCVAFKLDRRVYHESNC